MYIIIYEIYYILLYYGFPKHLVLFIFVGTHI